MEGQKDGRTDGMMESQKLCPSAFLRKGRGQKVTIGLIHKKEHIRFNFSLKCEKSEKLS